MVNVIKWIATVIICVGGGINAAGIQPYGIYSLLAGGSLWLLASIMMKDVPLIATNGVMTVFVIVGIYFNPNF
jgi:hypothetical protein